MTYTTLSFFAFCLLLFCLYYALPCRWRWMLLLLFSLVFYVLLSPTGAIFVLFSALTIYAAGLCLGRRNARQNAYLSAHPALTPREKKDCRALCKRQNRRTLAWAVSANLAILLIFKFYNLLIGHAWNLWATLAGPILLPAPLITLAMPLGISFYTLQAISYIVDIYRGNQECETHFGMLLLYLIYFPTIVQGPICRYRELAPQFRTAGRDITPDAVKSGIHLMFFGVMKKLLLADRINILVQTVFQADSAYEGVYLTVGIVLYSIQIYCDFSGGIDIVTGFSRMLGIALPLNFNHPYFSRSIPEFWRRWHITLGAWLKEYIFYPISLSRRIGRLSQWARRRLGPNAGKMLPVYVSLCFVWVANGAWHGARLQFILFGVYHGLLTMGGMLLQRPFAAMERALRIKTDCFSWRLFQTARTFVLGCIGRVIYKAPSLAAVGSMLWSILTAANYQVFVDDSLLQLGLTSLDFAIILIGCLALLGVSCMQERMSISRWLAEQNTVFRWLLYALALFAILAFGVYGPGYEASQFIYGQY